MAHACRNSLGGIAARRSFFLSSIRLRRSHHLGSSRHWPTLCGFPASGRGRPRRRPCRRRVSGWISSRHFRCMPAPVVKESGCWPCGRAASCTCRPAASYGPRDAADGRSGIPGARSGSGRHRPPPARTQSQWSGNNRCRSPASVHHWYAGGQATGDQLRAAQVIAVPELDPGSRGDGQAPLRPDVGTAQAADEAVSIRYEHADEALAADPNLDPDPIEAVAFVGGVGRMGISGRRKGAGLFQVVDLVLRQAPVGLRRQPPLHPVTGNPQRDQVFPGYRSLTRPQNRQSAISFPFQGLHSTHP